MQTNSNSNSKKKTRSYSWIILWWRIDQEALTNQVQDYKNLKFYQSARGQSVLLLILSAIINIIFIRFFHTSASTLFDISIFLVLAFFIYKGHKWAMIAAMLLWTIEKVSQLILMINSPPAFSNPNLIQPILWWSIYMHAFYFAFRIERARQKQTITT